MQDWGPIDHLRAVMTDPSAHPDRLLGAIAMLTAARECLEEAETDLVSRARAEGLTWREIAAAMSLGSPQAAAQRAHRRPRHADQHPRRQGPLRYDDADPDHPTAGSRRSRAPVHRRALQPGADSA